MTTSEQNIYEQGAMYVIDVEGDQLRAMRTTDPHLPWVGEDGALYADEYKAVRQLVVTDPCSEPVVGPEIDLGNMDSGYVEIDGKGWVPTEDYEQIEREGNAAADRLAALVKAAEFTRTDGTAPFKLSEPPERAQTRRVIEAAKWVLTGE